MNPELPEEEQAERFLESLGFSCEREPNWIEEGRKPDFFCRAEKSCWVEVKTLSQRPEEKRQDFFYEEFQRRVSAVECEGSVFACASKNATEKDVKASLNLAEEFLTSSESKSFSGSQLFFMVPRLPDYTRKVRISIKTQNSSVVLVSCESRNKKYQLPFGMEQNLLFDKNVLLELSDGIKIEAPLIEIWEQGCPLISLELSDLKLGVRPFEVFGFMLVDGDSKVRSPERIRECVKEANGQLRNGQKYKKAPSLLLLYQNHVIVPQDYMVIASLYGDLTWEFPAGDPDSGRFFYGFNGAFLPSKNRSTSALCFVRNDGKPLLVHNCWAETPFPVGIIPGKEVRLVDDIHFEFKEYS